MPVEKKATAFSNITVKHPLYVKWEKRWEKCRDCYGGQDELKEKAGRDVIEELGDIKGWQIRSIPMRIADSMVENATKRMGSIGLDTQGFFAKSLFQNKTFRKVAHD